jgi:cyclopropane-fatty-acyl-phospholipid synthase
MREYGFGEKNKGLPQTLPPIARRLQKELLDLADIRWNGDRPWDILVYDNRLFIRTIRYASLGFAESYMKGWWDCKQLDVLFTKILSAQLERRLKGMAKLKLAFSSFIHFLFNFQTVSRAFQVGRVHYDIGNNLYERMLGPSMIYSCGYWKEAQSLEQAQLAKLELICRKLKLEQGMTLLDIGCGWGALARHAATHYGVKVTGITISQEQYKLAKARTRDCEVEILLQDYRQLTGAYDRVVSVGMFEHVGTKNYRTFFEVVNKLLRREGIFLLHTIGQERSLGPTDNFISKYIFPNSKIPARKNINQASIDLLRLEDWQNFGPDYDKTLMAWANNFESHWSELKQHYNETFYRMWRFYLYSCTGYFRSRRGQLWQLVFTNPENTQPYQSVR